MGSAKGAVEAFGTFFPDIGEETPNIFFILEGLFSQLQHRLQPLSQHHHQHAAMSHARALSSSIVLLNRINEHLFTIWINDIGLSDLIFIFPITQPLLVLILEPCQH